MLFRLSPTGFEALLSGGEAKGRGMALEASADLSIFSRPAPGNLHLVNWGCHLAAGAGNG